MSLEFRILKVMPTSCETTKFWKIFFDVHEPLSELVITLLLCSISFVNCITSLDPIIFTGFQIIFIAKDIFEGSFLGGTFDIDEGLSDTFLTEKNLKGFNDPKLGV